MSTGCTAESKGECTIKLYTCTLYITESKSSGEEYNPCSFNKVMQGLDDLNKLLDDVKQRLDKSSSKCRCCIVVCRSLSFILM